MSDTEQELRARIKELECELSMYQGYWHLATLTLGDDKAREIMSAVNLAALTP